MDDTISSFGTFASPVKPNSRLNDFKILCKLGEGSFSTVYKVIRLADNKTYAMKKVHMSRLNEKEKGNSLNEIRILASIHSPHIIQYRDSFFDDHTDSLCIIMEYAGEGDLLSKLKEYKDKNQSILAQSTVNQTNKMPEQSNTSLQNSHIDHNHINSIENSKIQIELQQKDKFIQSSLQEKLQRKQYMEEELIWDYFVQSLKGLQCLHDMKILHRDLKCANIFIAENNIIKIGDLNVSKVTQRPEQMAKTQTGTPYYTAPEVWKGITYNHKSDIWSLGCIIYELCAQNHPFKGNTIEGLFTNIMKGKYDRIPDFYSEEMTFVISQCLLQNPKLRPSCDQLLKLPVFQSKLQRYEEKYKPLLYVHQKQKIHFGNELLGNSYHESQFTPQRAQKINTEGHHLIDTINLPSSMKKLSALLPKSNYDEQNAPQPSVSVFDENSIKKRNKSSFVKQRKSMEMISEFDQLEKISSVASSSSSSPQGATRYVQKTSQNTSQLIQGEQQQVKQDNIFQALLDLQAADLLHHPNADNQVNEQNQVQSTIENQNYHNLVEHSPIRLTLKRVQMDNSDKKLKQPEQQLYAQEQNQYPEQIQEQHNKQPQQLRSSNSKQIGQRLISLQKVNSDEKQKENKDLIQSNNSSNNYIKNSIYTTAQTNKYNNESNYIVNKDSYRQNQIGISYKSSPNQSLQKNASSEQKCTLNTSQNIYNNSNNNNYNNIESSSVKVKKLKIRLCSSALRNSRTVECPTENINKLATPPTHEHQLQINQQQTLISEETYPKFSYNTKYTHNFSNIFAPLNTKDEEVLYQNKINCFNNRNQNDVRNFRIRNNRNSNKDERGQNNILQEQILKTEEDFSSYSPTIFSRGIAAPSNIYDRGQRISTILSQEYSYRRPPSSKPKKSLSPQYKVAQFTQLMKRYLPKAVLKNGMVVVQSDRNNSQNRIKSSYSSHSQAVPQQTHRNPIIYHQGLPNSAKYHSHKVATAAAINNSLVSQLNNSSYNSNNASSLNGANNQNYSFNNMQNSYSNSPPFLNKENINTINILNNSFGFNKQSSRPVTIQKENNSAVRAVQYDKGIFPINSNHIQIVKKIKNVQNLIDSHNINRSSPPKKSQEQSSRRNIFYNPTNLHNFNHYENPSNVHKVAYNQNHKSISSKQNHSNRQSNSQERKSIRSNLR